MTTTQTTQAKFSQSRNDMHREGGCMTTTEKFPVRNRFTGEVQFEASIEVTPDMTPRFKIGLAVKWARKNGANLGGADLGDADLRGAYLGGANLRGADLRDAYWIPKIENIHSAVYQAASAKKALDMSTWHTDGFCGTTHCRAGWVNHLAGEGGRVLEGVYGPSAAAALIYMASDPKMEKIPDWVASNEAALADMKRLADAEVAA